MITGPQVQPAGRRVHLQAAGTSSGPSNIFQSCRLVSRAQESSAGAQAMLSGRREPLLGRRKGVTGPNQVLSRSKSLCMQARVQ